MGRFISKFNTTAELATFSATTAFSQPHVSLTNDSRKINFFDPYNGHKYVKIGGLKWATMNIGAKSVTDAGLYFQWGDVSGYTAEQVGSGEGQKYFGWADYKYGNGTSEPGETGMTKYSNTDGKSVLDLEDDAARANWGGSWRMPTSDELQALGAAVNTAWTSDYQGSGIAGIVCADKTDNSKVLFFPTTGVSRNGEINFINTHCNYWSSSLYSGNVIVSYYSYLSSGGMNWKNTHYRFYGFAVRPVIG